MSNTRKRIKTKKGKHTSATKTTPRDRHIAAIQAQADRYRAMTPVGIRRVLAGFPELEDLIDYCSWLVAMVDPTAGRSMEATGRGGQDSDEAMFAAGARVAWYRKHQDFITGELAKLNRQIKDKIEGSDFDRYREEAPRCWHRDCVDRDGKPTRGRRQPIDATECRWCGRPFSEGQRAANG